MQYIFNLNTNKEKSQCVGLISHVFSKKKCMQKLPFCSLVLLRFQTFLANVEFDDGYSKNPVSVTKKDTSDYM